MFKKILKSFALVAILALVALSGSVVLAQTIPATPGICTVAEMGTIPGCNPPINTGFTAQIKDGSLGILGILSLISGRHLDTAQDLGSSTDSTLRADYAGLIGYLTGYKLDWDGISIPPAITNTSPARHALVIYGGAGADNEGYRLVKLWDNLDVVGTTTASNMDVHNNVYAKNFYTCPTPGSCSIINPGGGYWTKSGVNLYATTLTDNVGIGDDTPSYKLDVAGTVRATSDFRVDAGSGSANATLNLVGRYSGTAYPASTFANMLGGLSINPNAAAPVVGIRLNPTTGATLQVGGNQAIGYANNTAAPTNGLAVNGEVGITSLVDLGFSKTPDVDRETNAGKIAYQKWSTGLDIVGAGPKNSSDRLVKLWDNVTIPGDLNVDGTTTLNNLVVNNVCTADGSCSTGGLGNWTKNGNNIYNNNSANVGIGIANPSHTLHVVNKETGDSANYTIGIGRADKTQAYWLGVGDTGSFNLHNQSGTGGTLMSVTNDGNIDITGRLQAAGLVVPNLGDAVKAGSNNALDLGYGTPGRESNAGKIFYGKYDTQALEIVGAGNDGLSRKVTIWDNLNVVRNVNIGGVMGIGTNAPTRELHIVSNNGAQIKLQDNGSTDWSGIEWQNPSGIGYMGVKPDGHFFVDMGQNGEDFAVDGSGIVQIGYRGLTKQADAGKIGYQVWGNHDALDIVGAGINGVSRRVRIYDELMTGRICNADGTKCLSVDTILDHIGGATPGGNPGATLSLSVNGTDNPANQVGPGGTLLVRVDEGITINYANAVAGCNVDSSSLRVANSNIPKPVSGTASIGPYYPKLARVNLDYVTLSCPGFSPMTVNVMVKPEITSFSAAVDPEPPSVTSNPNIKFTWVTRTGYDSNETNRGVGVADPTLTCRIWGSDKYYSGDTSSPDQTGTFDDSGVSNSNNNGDNQIKNISSICDRNVATNFNQWCTISYNLTCTVNTTNLTTAAKPASWNLDFAHKY